MLPRRIAERGDHERGGDVDRVHATAVRAHFLAEPADARPTGRAVVTTRLSSDTMNRAIEVIANVQSVRVLAVIGCLPFSTL